MSQPETSVDEAAQPETVPVNHGEAWRELEANHCEFLRGDTPCVLIDETKRCRHLSGRAHQEALVEIACRLVGQTCNLQCKYNDWATIGVEGAE